MQVQPELTFHQNQYSFRWKEKYTCTTFNMGLGAGVQFALSDRLFTEGGISIISRRLNTLAFLDQARLPFPYYDSTKILIGTQYILLRTLEWPLHLGYHFFKTPYSSFMLKAGITPQYLMNSYYHVARKYRADYRKAYWQGYSVNAALGYEQKLTSRYTFFSQLSYALKNTVKEDPYLFSQDERTIALPHTFLRLQMGIKMGFEEFAHQPICKKLLI